MSRPCQLLGPLVLAAACAQAEIVRLGTLEADSCSAFLNGLDAFTTEAGFRLSRAESETLLDSFLNANPGDGISDTEPVRATLISDSSLTNLLDFVVVADLPLLYPNQDFFQKSVAARYAGSDQTPLLADFTHYSSPRQKGLPADLFLSVANGRATLSTSAEAILWVLKHPAPPPRAAADGTTLRATLPASTFLRLPGTDSLPPPVKAAVAAGLDAAVISLRLARNDIGLALSLQPKSAATVALLAGLGAKSAPLTETVPRDALASAILPPVPFAVPATNAPRAFLLLDSPLLGAKTVYLTATRDKGGFCLVERARLANPAAADALLAKLDRSIWNGALALARGKSRRHGETRIDTYTFRLLPSAGNTPATDESAASYLRMTLPLFKKATLEVARRGDVLTLLIAPTLSADAEMDALSEAHVAPPYAERLAAALPELAKGMPLAGADASAVAILRQLVSVMPGVKPEHIRLFPVSSPHAHAGLALLPTGELRAALAVPTAEIASLRRLSTEGQETFHELLFLFMSIQLREMSGGR